LVNQFQQIVSGWGPCNAGAATFIVFSAHFWHVTEVPPVLTLGREREGGRGGLLAYIALFFDVRHLVAGRYHR